MRSVAKDTLILEGVEEDAFTADQPVSVPVLPSDVLRYFIFIFFFWFLGFVCNRLFLVQIANFGLWGQILYLFVVEIGYCVTVIG